MTCQSREDDISAGACSAWRIVESLWVAKELGLNRLICEQPAYHLLDRTAEREVIPRRSPWTCAIFSSYVVALVG